MTPTTRGRIAFVALLFAISLVGATEGVARGDASLLSILSPALATLGTGAVRGREAAVRAALAVAVLAVTGTLARLAAGDGLPAYGEISVAVRLLSGLFAFDLLLVALTSALLRATWPASDRWTL